MSEQLQEAFRLLEAREDNLEEKLTALAEAAPEAEQEEFSYLVEAGMVLDSKD